MRMKKLPSLKRITRIGLALVAMTASVATTQAQNQVFYENFEVDHSSDGTYVTNQTASSVNYVNLYFDYSTAGIPLAPNSTNSSTRALKMSANLSGGVFGGISVSPLNFGITDNFDMRFDAWFNFNGPMPGGGNGSTQVGGAGYGTAGTNVQVAGAVIDSIFIGGTAEGGSSADYRVYTPFHWVSYQDGDFRIGADGGAAPVNKGDPSSGYVYARTNRNAQPAYEALFPAQQCPTNQLLLYPQQTNSNGTFPGAPGFANPGTLAFKWHDVSLKKLGNTITYSINGLLIATVDVNDAGALGGTNILFNHYDINATSSTDPNDSNLIFTLIDNVRITNYANVITVFSTNSPTTAESTSPTPGVFTVVRSSTDASQPVTVNYSLTGSAVNGVDYTNLSGAVTFAAGATATNIYVMPINDSEPEVTESVVLDILSSGAYIGGGSATVTILDNEPGQLAITNVSAQVYERTNDFAVFRITRLGATNTPSFPVNLTFTGGSAGVGTDFYTTNTVSFEIGVSSTNFVVLPIEDLTFEGNETINVNIAPATGGEYTIGSAGSATVTLVDADYPVETVLFSENFDTDNSADWDVFFVTTNGAAADNTFVFNLDYSAYSVPASPHGGGTSSGMFMAVNKNDSTAVAAALNAYYKLQSFSGNYAIRFDLSLNTSAGGSATEYALFGLNHSGTKTNWWRSGGTPAGSTFDGYFAAVETDGGAIPGYAIYSSPATANNPTAVTTATNSAFATYFKTPPYAFAGSPAYNRTNTVPGPAWADVELAKIGNAVTLTINKKLIASYNNATNYTSGRIMLGYLDAFDSIGDAQGNFVLFDNLRVISLASPTITSITPGTPNVTIQFTANASPADQTVQFVVQSASSVTGPYTDVGGPGVGITSPTAGNFTATVAVNPLDAQKYYRVRRVY